MLDTTVPMLILPSLDPGAGRGASTPSPQPVLPAGRTEQSALWELLMRPA
jgi:hypothetical protein